MSWPLVDSLRLLLETPHRIWWAAVYSLAPRRLFIATWWLRVALHLWRRLLQLRSPVLWEIVMYHILLRPCSDLLRCFLSLSHCSDLSLTLLRRLRRFSRGHQNSKNNTGSNFFLKVWLTPPLSSYLKRLFQAKNGNSKYLYLYFIYPPARRAITSTLHSPFRINNA